jgi:hypothetical protein
MWFSMMVQRFLSLARGGKQFVHAEFAQDALLARALPHHSQPPGQLLICAKGQQQLQASRLGASVRAVAENAETQLAVTKDRIAGGHEEIFSGSHGLLLCLSTCTRASLRDCAFGVVRTV